VAPVAVCPSVEERRARLSRASPSTPEDGASTQ